MSFAERLVRWNRLYDGMPEMWRFQFVVWSLIVLGAINMLLTLTVRFPFALLIVLGIICITAIRVPYAFGWIVPQEDDLSHPKVQITGGGWLIDLNRRYEQIPDTRRMWVYPIVLVVAGAINMMLTIAYGFPFGLLFLIALLVLVFVRAPYTAGWLQPRASGPGMVGSEPFDPALEHAPPQAVEAPAHHPVEEADLHATGESGHDSPDEPGQPPADESARRRIDD